MLGIIIVIFHLILFVVISCIIASYSNSNKVSSNCPSVSVIVASHNELENLKKLVPKLLAQNYADFEIIISLDRCTDESYKYLKSLNHPAIKIISISKTPSDWNAKKYALHSAIEQAKNDWLVFTDADCLPVSNNWLSEMASKITEKTAIVIGFSPYQSNGSLLQSMIQFEGIMTGLMYLSSALLRQPYMSVGRNMAVKCDFFIHSDGYEPFKQVQGGDDDLFIQKNATSKNTKVCIGEKSNVFTYPKTTWKAYFLQKLRHLSVGTKYKLTHRLALSVLHSSHLLSWIIFCFHSKNLSFLVVLGIYLTVKWLCLLVVIRKIGIKNAFLPFFPVLDLLYAIMIPAIGVWSLFVKNIKWKS